MGRVFPTSVYCWSYTALLVYFLPWAGCTDPAGSCAYLCRLSPALKQLGKSLVLPEGICEIGSLYAGRIRPEWLGKEWVWLGRV